MVAERDSDYMHEHEAARTEAKRTSVCDWGSPKKNIIAYGIAAAVLVGVARIDYISGVATRSFDKVASVFHEPDALERIQNGQAETISASSPESAVAKLFDRRFSSDVNRGDASGEFFLINEDTIYAVACDDAPGNGGYDDESVVMREVGADYNPALYDAYLEVLSTAQGNDVFLLVEDKIGQIDLANTLAGQGGDFTTEREVLVSGYDMPGKFYTGFTLYENHEPLESNANDLVAPTGP